MNFNGFRPDQISQAEGDGKFRLGEVAVSCHNHAALGVAGGADNDHGANGVAVACFTNKFKSQVMVVGVLVIAQQERRAVDLSHDDVEIAVSVNVGQRRPGRQWA